MYIYTHTYIHTYTRTYMYIHINVPREEVLRVHSRPLLVSSHTYILPFEPRLRGDSCKYVQKKKCKMGRVRYVGPPKK
jgi:hypothetical protein